MNIPVEYRDFKIDICTSFIVSICNMVKHATSHVEALPKSLTIELPLKVE